jgi:C-terminal binding-module, SLH-like, of glucodextranase
MRSLGGVVGAAAIATLALALAPAADAGSLYQGPGPRPGPDLLYSTAPVAPQLENASPWKAPPILISGAEAYRHGEFLYQDYLYDDHGAAGTPDPADPFNAAANLFSPKRGTLTYPTDPVFANNAADLVELRVKPLASATAFRVTLNTLKDPGRSAFTIALGSSPGLQAWPYGAGVRSPAQLFLTVHGTTAVLTDATTGTALAPAPTASVDLVRRQIEVRVPHRAWNPGTSVIRMAAGVGLWDLAAGTYLQPGATATATQPGGCAGPPCPALFNMAFRLNEPVPRIYEPGTANTIAEGSVTVKLDGSWWRERRQGDVLATGDVSEFNAEVDFGKLRARVADESLVPKTGHMDRIMASHFELGQGADYNAVCLTSKAAECTGRFPGQLQPYALFVPAKPLPSRGFGLVVSMHGLSANYNEFLGSHEAAQMGEEGTGSIFASPESRGPDGGYASYAEADVFEMWADVARHYRLNPDHADVTGYSMGGGGTYRLASRWPDLWARAFPIVGPPTSAASFTSLRNIPVMAWYGQNDELVGPEMSDMAFLNAQQAGLRYDHWVFTPAGHVTEGNNDEYTPAAEFFGENLVDRNPFHVTYVVDPSLNTVAESPADHAYWISGLAIRTAGSTGKIDAFSHAAGLGDPPALPVALSAGTLNGGSHGPLPYSRRTLAWGPAPLQPKADRIDVTVTNLAAATIEPRRAGVDCKAQIQVVSDGAFELTLAGCNRVIRTP